MIVVLSLTGLLTAYVLRKDAKFWSLELEIMFLRCHILQMFGISRAQRFMNRWQ